MAARGFLPEIQALRALAVGLVVVYHLQPGVLTGGFIGVDVFFVVSGFLITGHLLREHARSGRIRLSAFWAARARRILPAGLVCIALTIAAVFVVYPPTQWAHVGYQALAAALSVLNWVLAAESVDYLAADGDATPFQHFWSLGVEEQFYLLWPFAVILACVLALRLRRRMLAPTVVFGVVVIASFAYGAAQVASGDPATYFATTSRVWELAVGGLLALWLPRLRIPGRMRTTLSLTGVGAIVAGALLIDGADPFPGFLALVPVLGALAVVAGGSTSGMLAPARVYAWRPVQWVGDVSYSLYLWHFPPIVLFVVATGARPDALASVVLVAFALAAAWASYRFVEQPTRRSAWLSARPGRGLLLGAASVVVVATIAVSLPVAEQRAEANWVALADEVRPTAEGAAAMDAPGDESFPDGTVAITPAPTQADADEPTVVKPGCTGVPRAEETPVCTIGDPDGDTTVALVGDSHAKQIATAVDAIAKDRGWRVVTYLHASCPFNPEVRQVEADGGVRCQGPNEDTLAALLADPPSIVFVASWAAGDYVDTATGHTPGAAGYAEAWNTLADAGSEILVFKDVPKPHTAPIVPDCIARNYDNPDACGMTRADGLEGRDIVDEAQRLAPRVHVIDFTDRLCDATACPAVIGNVLVYRDTNHVTDTFMQTLVPFIEQRVDEALSVGPQTAAVR